MHGTTWHPPTRKRNAARFLRKRHRIIWPLLMMVILPFRIEASDAMPDLPGSGGLLLRMQSGYSVETALNTDVDIVVNGLVSRVTVRQEFRNSGSEWVEGVYVFPLPDGAAVDHMRLRVGERVIEGEIQEKAEAQKTYEEAKAKGQKTSLVEQQRANLFTTSVANIAPGELVSVEIEYLEQPVYDAGTFSLRFPMTLTPRYIPGEALPDRQGSGWSADTTQVIDASLITPPMVAGSNDHRISLDVFVNAGMPLDVIASRYHPVSVNESNGRYTVSLSDADTLTDHDFELLWRPVANEAPQVLGFSELIDGEPYYLLMLMPPTGQAAAPLRVPRETIFIIDTSGSMHGTSIRQAREALGKALERLQPGDRFNVVEFNSSMRPLFADSVDASPVNLRMASRFVERLNANGGTEMKPALQFALARPVSEAHLRQVIFITDGSVGNEEALYQVIEQRLGGARLFTVGIGSAPNSWFMRKAAELGRGTFTIISAMHEVGEKMDRLFRKLESPQLTDIAIEWPDGIDIDAYPARVPDLYAGEPVSVRVRADRLLAGVGAVSLAGNLPSGPWTATLPLPREHDGFGVGALWARARIEELLDSARRGADAGQVKKAVVETALAHHLVSPHTSLVAVDKTPARPIGSPLSREQIPNLMPHGQSVNAIFGFPATATPAMLLRLQGVLVLLLAAAVMFWQRRRHAALA